MVNMLAKQQQYQHATIEKFMGDVLKRIEETPKTDSRAEARGTVAAEAVGPHDAGQHAAPMRAHVPDASAFTEPSPFATTVSSSSRQAPGGNPWDSAA